MFVKMWMCDTPVTIQQDATIAEATALMAHHRIRRLPVVNGDDQLVGIVSTGNIINATPSPIDASFDDSARALANQTKVAVFMTPNPITVGPLDPLEKVASSMRKNKIGGVPVVEQGTLIGIITESDIFQAFIEVLGSDEQGVRIELNIDRGSDALYDVLDICRDHHMFIRAVTVCNNFSEERQLLTIRVQGDNLEEMIDDLWKSDCKINSILNEEGPHL